MQSAGHLPGSSGDFGLTRNGLGLRSGGLLARKVWLPSQARWLTGFLHEMKLFPYGRHDEQVDALSQGLRWLATMSGPEQWLRMMDERIRRLGISP